jgi:hypothetical protein
MLDEGVAQAPMDIDLAMITGAGFQFWNGGLTPLLDRTGRRRAGHREALPARGRGERPRLSTNPSGGMPCPPKRTAYLLRLGWPRAVTSHLRDTMEPNV